MTSSPVRPTQSVQSVQSVLSALPLLSVLTLSLVVPLLGCSTDSETSDEPAQSAGVVNVYSARHYDTDDQLYARFEEETGIRVNLIEGESAALLERLEREGDQSPADLFITVDAGRLYQAESQGIFRNFN